MEERERERERERPHNVLFSHLAGVRIGEYASLTKDKRKQWTDGPTDGPMDRWTKPCTELRVRN